MTDLYAVRTFEEFWPHYAALHSRRETQWMHALASGACLTLLGVGLARRSLPLLVLAPLADHAIAQASHRIFEKNRTLPWKNTLWHTRAEFRMLRLVLTGQMSRAPDVATSTRPPPRRRRTGGSSSDLRR